MEIYVGENARVRYSTIENWSKNMYNLNTKRARVEKGGTIEWVSGSFGSHTSCLYPMSILAGEGARMEFTGITFAGAGQDLTPVPRQARSPQHQFPHHHQVHCPGRRHLQLPQLRHGPAQREEFQVCRLLREPDAGRSFPLRHHP